MAKYVKGEVPRILPAGEVQSSGDGEGPNMTDLSERLGRLEGAFEGMRHSQNMLGLAVTAVGAIIVALIIGLGAYTLVRLDQQTDKIDEIPGKISADLRDITKTLAESITAAKQQD